MPPTNIPFTGMYCRPLPTLALISDTNWSSSQRFISPATKIAERALMSLHQLPQHGHEACVNPKFSSWGKEVLCQVVDVDPITVLGNFKNG